jgi:dCMP deaminase
MSISWENYFFNICEEVRRKSKDHSVKVGCVIAGPDNEIRSTGFNGFPRGVDEDEPALKERLGFAKDEELTPYDMAGMEIEPRLKAIKKRHERPDKYLWTEHAERNAIYAAARVGIPLKGCVIYVDWIPCADCARAIVQSGITRVIIDGRKFDEKLKFWMVRWHDHMKCSFVMFDEAGVDLNIWEGSYEYGNEEKHKNIIRELLNGKEEKKE